MLLISLIYVIPLLLLRTILVSCGLFQQCIDKNIKNRHWHVRLMLLEQVLAQWWHSVASSEALDLLQQAIRAVSYRRIARGHQNGQLCWCIYWLLLLPWWTLGQYRASSCPMPVSSGFRSSPGYATVGGVVCIAPCTAVAIKTAGGQGAFVRHCQFYHQQ